MSNDVTIIDFKHNDSVASSLSDTSSANRLIDQKMAKSADHNKKESEEEFSQPDGGWQAWLVMLCSFQCNGVIFGIINSYGAIFVHLKEGYKGDPEAATKASLVGSLAVGMTFLLSPVSSILVDKYGVRKTAFLGSLITFLGMLSSAFAVEKIEALYFTYGILFGGGSSLIYTPSLVILGHYFKRHMGLVNGFVTTGSSIFTIAMPHVLEALLKNYGLKNCLLVLAGSTATLIFASLSFKPLMPPPVKSTNSAKGGCCSQIINLDNWKNKKYVIWSLAIPSALFGYFVPYVHIVQHVKDTMPGKNGRLLVTCIAVTSGIGRLIFGKIADLPRVNRIFLQQISFVSIGICTMLLTAAPYFTGFEFESMIMFSLIMGLFDGCFITMLGPIAYDICGPAGASQAIGFLLGLCSIPLTVGPPIAGFLCDQLGNYTVAFLAAGIPPIVGAFLMCLIYRIPHTNNQEIMIIGANSPNNGGQQQPTINGSATATTTLALEAAENESLLQAKNNGDAVCDA